MRTSSECKCQGPHQPTFRTAAFSRFRFGLSHVPLGRNSATDGGDSREDGVDKEHLDRFVGIGEVTAPNRVGPSTSQWSSGWGLDDLYMKILRVQYLHSLIPGSHPQTLKETAIHSAAVRCLVGLSQIVMNSSHGCYKAHKEQGHLLQIPCGSCGLEFRHTNT